MKSNLQISFQYGLTLFLSAFLLFLVQPLIGKMILPWFGGSASVWTICMLFFQAILLIGYVYSHLIIKVLNPYKQSIMHLSLLIFSIAFLPITASEFWKPTGSENPTLQILGLLLVSIGLPYFVLSTTGPLVQSWFAREKTNIVPYRLFALSNFGSMLALLAYPIVFEPVLSTQWQSYCWSSAYCFFVVFCGVIAWRNRNRQAIAKLESENSLPPKFKQIMTWVLLAACPSILMVADTSFLTENIAPIPLIWVAPLALYLLSFIICFEWNGWYNRKLFLPLLVIALFILAYLPTMGLNELPVFISMTINLLSFFIVCIVCHGELAMQQPDSQYLTIYYLMLAIGGVVGGFFVGVIAPYWFNENYELSVGIILTGIVISKVFLYDIKLKNNLFKISFIGISTSFIILISYIRINDHYDELSGSELSIRNFYGSLKVYLNEKVGYRSMRHGQISHGRQNTDPNKLLEPTTYYIPESGVGKVILLKESLTKSIKLGVVGLGVGTLAGYGRSADTIKFYEINPQVVKVAKEKFTFLSKSPAKIDLVLGDARLILENEISQQFDVLVIDAFSGDSVPIHLLTEEAFSQYFRHLKKDGILAIHITNRFLNLKPVVKTAADHYGKDIRMIEYTVPEGKEKELFRSQWAIIASNQDYFQNRTFINAQKITLIQSFKPWKDNYSSIISLIY